ncbi:zinc knuckle CX2CX4HX4C containing protein [Tanacetum coccineum]
MKNMVKAELEAIRKAILMVSMKKNMGIQDLEISIVLYIWGIGLLASYAIVPTMIVAIVFNESEASLDVLNECLNVLQSIQIPFALIPLLTIVAKEEIIGSFKIGQTLEAELEVIRKAILMSNHVLVKEITEHNRGLIDTLMNISEEDVDPAATYEGCDGTVCKCSFSVVALGPNLKSQYASAQMPYESKQHNHRKCSVMLSTRNVRVFTISADSINRAWEILDQIPGRATGAYSHRTRDGFLDDTFGVPLTTVADLQKLINDIDAGKHDELLSELTNEDRMETLEALGSICNSIKVDRNNADVIPCKVSYADDSINLNVDESTIPSDPIVQSVDINKSTSYAGVAGGSAKDQPNVNSNFRTLVADPVFDGVNISIPRKVVEKVSTRFEHTLYGYFIGKRMAFPIVEYYARNNWAKHGLKRIMMNSKGFFFFKFDSRAGLEAVLKGGPWLIRKSPSILKKWSMDTITPRVLGHCMTLFNPLIIFRVLRVCF